MADLVGAYADARRRLGELLAGLDEAALAAPVPACPAWTVRDILAHVTGVAADAAGGTYFSGAADAWSDTGLAAARDEWTAGQVRSRRDRPVQALVAEWAGWAAVLEPMLAGTVPAPPGSPAWLLSAPVADLAVHLHDVRGALRRPGDRDAPATGLGLRIYARWLGERLDQAGRPALRLRVGDREWVEGSGPPAAALTADPFELFRALSGRRSLDQVRALAWDGGPEPYLDLFAPYPMPASPLVE
ncbi:MAG TPA: maleylpyruvate isomerase family mycothiol-dependent enzyme [Actinomycetes bacterium]|jgi:uncharacterized protein (TIGR03083 family)|nr:maleylpyruvate isomerase family mycothiol-dependent enzyme [Actinomycetes bacterium]